MGKKTETPCWCPIHYLGVWNGVHQHYVQRCGYSQFKGYSASSQLSVGYCSGVTCTVAPVPEDCETADDSADVRSRMRSIAADALRKAGLTRYVGLDEDFDRDSDDVCIHDHGAVEFDIEGPPRETKRVRLLSVRLVVRCGRCNYGTEWMHLGQELDPSEHPSPSQKATHVRSVSDYVHEVSYEEEVDGHTHKDLFVVILKGSSDDKQRPPS